MGTEVHAPLRRRLAAVLAADAVGYSRLIAKDGPSTIHALDVAREAFRRYVALHGGSVIDMAGDSVLAVFDTAGGAVEAALAVQSELGAGEDQTRPSDALSFRIGVHLGDLFEKQDGTVYGDGVNIASRLQALAAAGGVVVSDSVRGAVQGKIGATFIDQGLHQVKNIAEPVRAFKASAASIDPTPGYNSRRVSEELEKPSIAVLPFHDLSGDPEQEFLADGMCEDIITLLSGVSSFLVISRSSTFAYKNKPVDVRTVAKELRVRYVLQGSIRRSGKRIRVTAQFVDAERGTDIWAENYDRALEDIFALQDDVAQAIVGTLQSRFLNAEFAFVTRRSPDTVGAWGNIVRAKIKLFAFRRRDLDDAEPFARGAIEIDPNYGEAHAVLGHILAWRALYRWSDSWLQSARDSAASCARALQLAPNNAAVLTDIGAAYWFLGRLLPAAALLEKSQSLNSNSAMNCAQLGQALACVGRAEEGLALVARAFRLSPKDPLEYLFHGNMAFAEYFSGQFERARESALRALTIHPDLVQVMLMYMAICVRLERLDDARLMLEKVNRLGASWAIDNLFRPRTQGTPFAEYTDAIRRLTSRPASV